jgi:hypothetical protein
VPLLFSGHLDRNTTEPYRRGLTERIGVGTASGSDFAGCN